MGHTYHVIKVECSEGGVRIMGNNIQHVCAKAFWVISVSLTCVGAHHLIHRGDSSSRLVVTLDHFWLSPYSIIHPGVIRHTAQEDDSLSLLWHITDHGQGFVESKFRATRLAGFGWVHYGRNVGYVLNKGPHNGQVLLREVKFIDSIWNFQNDPQDLLVPYEPIRALRPKDARYLVVSIKN